MAKKANAALILIGIFLVFAVIAVVAASIFGIFKIPFAIGGLELSLAQEYQTTWSSVTDGSDFSATSSVQFGTGSTSCKGCDGLTIDPEKIVVEKGQVTFDDQNYHGKEVVMLIGGNGYYEFSSKGGKGVAGSCSVPGTSLPCVETAKPSKTSCTQTLIEYVPDTLDLSKYDVIRNGIKVNTIDVGDTFHPHLNCQTGQLRGNHFKGFVEFIGSKSRFCDVRDNEVWVQELFASPVNIDDLAFTPTQFCHTARPFTLRKLGVGEAPIKKQNGIIPFNRGETIPSRALNDEILAINYAVVKSQCEAQGCKSCELGEANVYHNGQFSCANFLKDDDEVESRDVLIRDIVAPDLPNTFSFSATHNNRAFSIGNKRFEAEQFFSCGFGDDEKFNAPNPDASCYSSKVNYPGFSRTVADGEKVKLDNSISFKYLAAGRVEKNDVPVTRDLIGVYQFEISDPLIMRLHTLDIDDGSFFIELKNNLPPNEIIIKINQRAERAEINVPENTVNVHVENGINEITIPYDKFNLGINNLEVTAFYPVQVGFSQVLLEGKGVQFGIDVKHQVADVDVISESPSEIPIGKKKNIFLRFWDFLKGLFGF